MNILIHNDSPHAHFFERVGIAKAFQSAGHSVTMWNPRGKSAFDIFSEENVDLFIGQTYNIDRALIKCLAERPHIKVIMKGSDWGPISDTLDRQKYPVLIANQEEVNNVKMLLDKVGKPDYLFIHYHQDYLDGTHGHWQSNFGLKTISLLNGADVFDYTNGRYYPEFSSDVCFVGGYWPYKSITLDDYMVRLCNPKYNLNIKIFGNQPWPVPQYCGNIDTSLVRQVLSSAKVCPNVSELHSRDLGYDIVERPFKLMSNKCLVVSDYVEGLSKLFDNNELIMTNSSDKFVDTVLDCLHNPKDVHGMVDRAYLRVLKEHTYFDRCASIFDNLYLPEEAQHMNKTKLHVLKELKL